MSQVSNSPLGLASSHVVIGVGGAYRQGAERNTKDSELKVLILYQT